MHTERLPNMKTFPSSLHRRNVPVLLAAMLVFQTAACAAPAKTGPSGSAASEGVARAAKDPALRTASGRKTVDLTVYNSGLSLVREERTLTLDKGAGHTGHHRTGLAAFRQPYRQGRRDRAGAELPVRSGQPVQASGKIPGETGRVPAPGRRRGKGVQRVRAVVGRGGKPRPLRSYG